MRKRLIYFTFLFVLISSCRKDKTSFVENEETCEDVISFQTEILPLITTNCSTSGCHNSSSQAAGYVFSSHANISFNHEIIRRVMNHEAGISPMPIGQPKLTSEQIQSFVCWIEQGVLNN
jgi:hypothetical protein